MHFTYHNTIFKKTAAALIGAAVGVAVFLWLFGTQTLHVTQDGWILNGYVETDILQHYAGWVLFRNSHWSLPLGFCDLLAAPDGTFISYTDSLPWVSIFFKLLRSVLPPTFQWFGWYVLFCFGMQGAAGALLSTRSGGEIHWSATVLLAALGGLLFACLPTLWERAFRHVALTSQYLILFALYFYLEYRSALAAGRQARWGWVFVFLPFVAVGIHPYFLPPVMLCTLLAGLELWRQKHRPVAGMALFGGGVLGALAGAFLLGALGTGVSASRFGYGDISMNLNAIFNPSSRGGFHWSRALPVQQQFPDQYDGFNYLGLGVLLLVCAALGYSVWQSIRSPITVQHWWKRNGLLFGACVFLSLFAVTNHITLGQWSLEIPLPQVLTDLCGIFRSSGRMFYLVAVCMVVFGINTLRCMCSKLSGRLLRDSMPCLLLTAVCAVQLWDISPAAAEMRALLERPAPEHTAASDYETEQIGVGNTRLWAAGPLREDRTRELAILAGKQGLATNISIAVSGEYPQAQASILQADAQLESGSYDSQTVYVTTEESQYQQWQQIFGNDPNVGFCVVNSCYFMVPLHTIQ
ncbi:DUF6311 domain-containing protein [uncultured Gemmiger sp.]|uniref:DUF6311 domain-containing protein n=1 Tax=uncultured Gemmiger sp. TaxID=1623490 RepID=UPI0025D47BA9|nr:DUF6311 domain-containing protein [uncultured Gemmiger sp.]